MADPQRGAGGIVSPLSPYQINVQSATRGQIARGSGADWFGPLDPLRPIAPPDVAGRRFDFPVGYNLVIRPRAYEPIGFHELRGFADAYDLLRLVIETRKDQMERQCWRIRPRDPKFKRKSASINAEMSARIAAAEKFLHKPDGVTRWKTWLRALLEDMFVIDAATLYCQRTRAGQLCALQQLDGATIKRIIDDWGRTPQPYAGLDGETVNPPAYQQVLKGLPAVNYAARDIIYRPRNVRAHRVYGYSPVQQILMTVNIALRRQLWQLDYYAEGSIPDALIGVPQGWTPDQIKQFQDYWDTEFSGDLARRRRAKFVPGDTAARVVQTKEPEQKNDFDEWLARIVCFAFSVPPQWAVKAMNRATADNQSAQAEEEGLEPTKEWVKELIDELLAEEFASPDLEFFWLDEDTDEKTEQAQFEARVKIGAATLNELRDALGLDPFDVPAADRPMVLTATGYVPIEAGSDGAVGTNANGTAVHTVVQKYCPDQPRVPAGDPNGGQWTSMEAENGSNGNLEAQSAPRANGVQVASYKNPQVLSDAPDPTSVPGVQSAQSRVRTMGTTFLINGEWFEATPGQEARLEVAEGRWQAAMSRAREIDPNWKPTPRLFGDIEGKISALEAQAEEAESHRSDLACYGIGPGPYAGESIPARGPARDFTPYERAQINRIGSETGCHTCGTRDPETPSGNFVLDHQPPNALNRSGEAQRLFPQCLTCSRRQGGWIRSRGQR
jgi:hypothetical protein